MDRRDFLRITGAWAPCAAGATLAGSALAQERTATVSADWRAFELTADISIEDPGAQARLWIPCPTAPTPTTSAARRPSGASRAAAPPAWRRPRLWRAHAGRAMA